VTIFVDVRRRLADSDARLENMDRWSRWPIPENMLEQSEWFETVPIGEADRLKIGRDNVLRLLNLQ